MMLEYWRTSRGIRTIFFLWYAFLFFQRPTNVNCEGCVYDAIRIVFDPVKRMRPFQGFEVE